MAVIGRVREIDMMRNHDNASYEASLNPSPRSAITGRRPASAATATPRTFYQAPQRDFFTETAVRPGYRRPGLPRYDYGASQPGHRPYVSKYTIPPRY